MENLSEAEQFSCYIGGWVGEVKIFHTKLFIFPFISSPYNVFLSLSFPPFMRPLKVFLFSRRRVAIVNDGLLGFAFSRTLRIWRYCQKLEKLCLLSFFAWLFVLKGLKLFSLLSNMSFTPPQSANALSSAPLVIYRRQFHSLRTKTQTLLASIINTLITLCPTFECFHWVNCAHFS